MSDTIEVFDYKEAVATTEEARKRRRLDEEVLARAATHRINEAIQNAAAKGLSECTVHNVKHFAHIRAAYEKSGYEINLEHKDCASNSCQCTSYTFCWDSKRMNAVQTNRVKIPINGSSGHWIMVENISVHVTKVIECTLLSSTNICLCIKSWDTGCIENMDTTSDTYSCWRMSDRVEWRRERDRSAPSHFPSVIVFNMGEREIYGAQNRSEIAHVLSQITLDSYDPADI